MSSNSSRSETTASQSPVAAVRNLRIVDRDFWRKLLRLAGRLPFAEDLAAAFFCAADPDTPTRVRGILIAALAYFVIPTDAIPDFVAGFGFIDDAAVLAAALTSVSRHVKDRHYERARAALGLPARQPN